MFNDTGIDNLEKSRTIISRIKISGTKSDEDTSSAKRAWWNKQVEQKLTEQERNFLFCHDLFAFILDSQHHFLFY